MRVHFTDNKLQKGHFCLKSLVEMLDEILVTSFEENVEGEVDSDIKVS